MAKRKAEAIDMKAVAGEVVEREERDAHVTTLLHLDEQRRKLLEPILSQLPEDKGSLMAELKFYLTMGAVSWIETGRRLIALKEIIQEGEWLNALNELTISRMTASRAMRVAQKFGNLKNMLHLDPSKLVALLEVSDEEVKQIEKTGTVLGMSVDAIHAMTCRQLQDKLREERKANEKGKAQILKSDQKIRELNDEVKALKIGPSTDLEFIQRCEEIQRRVGIGIAQARSLWGHIKTDTQRDALIGTMLYIEKSVVLAADDIQAASDPTYDDSDAGRELLEIKPDGINWYDRNVMTWLTEMTRKAEGDAEAARTEKEKSQRVETLHGEPIS